MGTSINIDSNSSSFLPSRIPDSKLCKFHYGGENGERCKKRSKIKGFCLKHGPKCSAIINSETGEKCKNAQRKHGKCYSHLEEMKCTFEGNDGRKCKNLIQVT